MSWLLEDRALLAGFQAGDRKAMEAVYLHYAPRLSAAVFRGLPTQSGRVRVVSPFEVGVVVQETFTRAFQERARRAWDGTSPYFGYLSAIARNYMLNERRVREETTSEDALHAAAQQAGDASEVLGGAPQSPHDSAEERELTTIVEGFLAGCSQRERDVFKARVVERLTQEDAAIAVGLTRVQVRRLEANVRVRLLELFQRNGYMERAQVISSLLSSRAPHGAQP